MSEREVKLTAYEYDDRCPECNLAWWLFAPVPISGSASEEVRCIECKSVYPDLGRTALNGSQS